MPRPDHPAPLIWWAHLRRMAYVSLWALLLTLLAIITNRIPPELVELAQTLCWVFGLNVVAYYGGNAAEMFAKRGKP